MTDTKKHRGGEYSGCIHTKVHLEGFKNLHVDIPSHILVSNEAHTCKRMCFCILFSTVRKPQPKVLIQSCKRSSKRNRTSVKINNW